MNGLLQTPTAPVEQPTRGGYVADQSRKILTIPAICAMGGFSRWTWRRWVRSGIAPQPLALPGHPRWSVVAVEQFLTGRTSRYFGKAQR